MTFELLSCLLSASCSSDHNYQSDTPNPNPNPNRSDHNYQSDTAETRSSWSFRRGEQVLENYGQPNSIYFKYHGFWVPKNTHNCVAIQVPSLRSIDKITASVT